MNNETYIEIDTKTLKENVEKIIKKRPNYDYYVAVIKGKAYGCGYEVAKYLIDTKINYFAVATLNEALEVRKYINKDFPVMCLQPVELNDIKLCIKENITITIPDYEYYKELTKIKSNKKLKIQIKLNTGMNRIGINNKEEVKLVYDDLITNKKHSIELEGIYSHFATLGIVDSEWDLQVKRFKDITSLIDLNNIKMVHMYSSNSLSIHPKLDFCNTVRIGQLLFGNYFNNINEHGFINKLKKIKREHIRKTKNLSKLNDDFFIDVKPVFKLVSTIQSIKSISAGERVGYDGEYLATEDTMVAMVPIGYAEGLNKNFTNKYVLINNKKYQIIGEINMCMTLIKVDKNVKLGDKVIFIGNELTPKKVASSLGIAVPYMLCSFDSYIKKVYK